MTEIVPDSILRAVNPKVLFSADRGMFLQVACRLERTESVFPDSWAKVAIAASSNEDRDTQRLLARLVGDAHPVIAAKIGLGLVLAPHGAQDPNRTFAHPTSEITIPLDVVAAAVRRSPSVAAAVGRLTALTAETGDRGLDGIAWIAADDPGVPDLSEALATAARTALLDTNLDSVLTYVAASRYLPSSELRAIAVTSNSITATVAAVRHPRFPTSALADAVRQHPSSERVHAAILRRGDVTADAVTAITDAVLPTGYFTTAEGSRPSEGAMTVYMYPGFPAKAAEKMAAAAVTHHVETTLNRRYCSHSEFWETRDQAKRLLMHPHLSVDAATSLLQRWIKFLQDPKAASHFAHVPNREIAGDAVIVAEAALNAAVTNENVMTALGPWLPTLLRRKSVTLTDEVMVALSEHSNPKIATSVTRRLTQAMLAGGQP